MPKAAKDDGAGPPCSRTFAQFHPGISHEMVELVTARTIAICCHEDGNHFDRLRHDPLMKLAVGRCPETGAALASQSTISWLMRVGSLPMALWARRQSLAALLTAAASLLYAPVPYSRASEPEAIPAHTNVASHRPYQLLPAPNYDTASGNAAAVLTDGGPASDRYWVNGTSLGWTRRSPVLVDVALAESTPVSNVRVQAGAKLSGGIYFPAQILVYGGDASGRFGFLGSSALAADGESTHSPTLREIDVRFAPRHVSRFVIVVFARGAFIFLGEVAAFTEAAGAPLSADLADLGAVRDDAARQRRRIVAERRDPAPSGPDVTRRWAMPIDVRPPSSMGSAGCSVTRLDPWTLAPLGAASATATADPGLVSVAGGRDYAAWRIANATGAPATAEVDVATAAGVSAKTYALAHAQALDYSWVPDVVAPFAADLLPVRSAIVVLVELSPATVGRHAVRVTPRCNGAGSPFELSLVAVAPDETAKPLHGNLWADLNEPVAQALRCDPGFLARHGIDSADVHPDALVDTGAGVRPTKALRKHLRAYRTTSRVMLFMDIKTRPWAFLHMSDDAAVTSLRDWWSWVQAIAKEEAVEGELLLFPIDEPMIGDVARLSWFARLARRAGITAPVYATVYDFKVLALLPLDIVQLLNPTWPEAKLARLAGSREVHAYSTFADGRLLSADTHYRRMGWRAHELGLQGVGAWAIWDGTGLNDPASGWNPFGTNERDYGLLYAAPDGCVWPSRRLLAWARGIEENQILRHCAKTIAAPPDASQPLATAVSRCVN